MRCGATYKSESQLRSHVTAHTPCDQVNFTRPDGITSDVERLLRSRKKSRRSQSDVERWKEMYRLLFPNEDLPSPCKFYILYNPVIISLTVFADFEPVQEEPTRRPNLIDFSSYETYSRDAYTGMVRTALERDIRDETLVKNLVENLERGHQTLLSDFRNLHASESPRTGGETMSLPILPESQSTALPSGESIFESSPTNYETYPRGYTPYGTTEFHLDYNFTSYNANDQARIPTEGFSAGRENAS